MANLIKTQIELHKQLDKALKNFKKTPKARLTETYAQVKLELLEDLWNNFKQNHQILMITTEINIHESDYIKNEIYDLTEDIFTAAKCEMKEILKTFCSPNPTSDSNQTTSSQSKAPTAMTPELKLPHINIPVFTGKYSEWIPFHDLFVSLIHRNSALMDVQKLHYLKSSLSGEAATLLKHIPISEANYEDAWVILQKRYNNKRFIVTSILKRLLSQKSLSTESAGTIKNLLDTTNECLSALNNIGVYTLSWDAILVHLTVTKLDPESIRLWEQQISLEDDGNSLPTFKQLCSYLESRFRTLEMLESTKTMSRPSTRQNTFHTTFKSSCKYCHGNHFIYQCKEFAHLTYTDRKRFVEQNRLCYNCLIPYHTVDKCKQRSTCRRCGKKHHSLIHPEGNTSDHLSPDAGGSSHIRDNRQAEVATTPVEHNVAAHYADQEMTKNVLLATALVKIHTTNGTTYSLRALIDPGSEGSFITESAAQFLGLKKTTVRCTINGLGDNDKASLTSTSMVTFVAQSRYDSNFTVPVQAFVLKSITRALPAQRIREQNWLHLHNLDLADPYFDTPGKVDILLSAEIYSEILKEGLRKGPRGTIIAQNTYLGWILLGRLHNEETIQSYKITTSMHLTIEDNLLQKFWEMESDSKHEKILTEEESRCEKMYEETYTRDKSGRFIVRLPFKEANPPCQYGSSRDIAEGRLIQLEKRFTKDSDLMKQYSHVMKEYLNLDFMEEIVEEHDRQIPTAVYIPHHAVINPKKTTVRVVMDASCKYKNGTSLNDSLMVGPRLQPDLRHIILRWRYHKICLVADITKMYLQIKVDEASSNYQRLLWRNNSTEDIKHYRMTRVTFGTASAPYLATKTLHQLAKEETNKYPLASKITTTDFYMDDLLSGADTIETAKKIYDEMNGLMAAGKFQLQKWNTNDTELLSYMRKADDEVTELEFQLEGTIKTLGIVWDRTKDEFQYSVDIPDISSPVTKRSIARDVAKLFDPMGWLAPVIIIGKIFLQKLWLTGVTWDQEVPSDLAYNWLKFREELHCLSDITVERWLNTTSLDTKLELYGFSDASTVAYGAVVYARVTDSTHKIHIHLISARTKVAPVKTISLPRLELCGAVLLTRLLIEIAEHLNVPRQHIYAYTDSNVVLSWLQKHPSTWKTFVANRTSEIITSLPGHHWFHVPSKENPADLASRGVTASKLKKETLWWKGPEWLRRDTIPHMITLPDLKEGEIEQRPVKVFTTQIENNFSEIFTRFSTVTRLQRVIALCKRFGQIRINKFPKYVTAEELDNALKACILICQQEEFSKDIASIKDSKAVKQYSNLRSLSPFLDKNGILRVGGRLRHANIPEEAKHQIILPDCHYLSKLIIANAHKKTLHGGPTLMLSFLRQNYWILGVKRMIKQEVHRCVICARHRATIGTQLMADLPPQRVTPTRPFLHSGVDFAGPVDLRISKGRGCKTSKGYLCIFICMATKAIHIEIVSSLESVDFIAAFKRFTARRGHCRHMWSDNATNFIAGNKELRALLKEQLRAVNGEILDMLARDGTEWHNIPPNAPHFGGIWEASVRSIKFHLKRILGNTTLTYEEMATVTAQVEACLNSRPISPISDDINDLQPLTPGHFLIGVPPIIVPERSYITDNINRLNRWQLVQRMVQHFWDRWTREYLSRLQQRPKWTKRHNNDIKIGDLVIVKDENLPPGKWSLARIIDVHPGDDGLIRVVSLRCRNSVIKRPLIKICRLPIDPYVS
ncbi:uncharacterized protein LOC131850012 [Achroia grisella]|uniref:uncharacterized protein LOC131850012 n=1 Tax=Achroia grisella TaxID=688607 RepID=UPI0027D2E7AA|nr:uncharacterized protein LOC131850012 [Achroia grisella]